MNTISIRKVRKINEINEKTKSYLRYLEEMIDSSLLLTLHGFGYLRESGGSLRQSG
jgi:hypothetical protein